MVSEQTIEQHAVREAKKRGGKALKFTSPSTKGVPDRLIILPGGKVGFLELKSSIGKPTKLQIYWLKYLEKLGCRTGIANSKDSVNQFMDILENDS